MPTLRLVCHWRLRPWLIGKTSSATDLLAIILVANATHAPGVGWGEWLTNRELLAGTLNDCAGLMIKLQRMRGIAMFNRKKLLSIMVLLLLTQSTFISKNCLAFTTQFQVAGRWTGKFPLPDDNSITEDENPIAVEVTIKAHGEKLSGIATFYLIRNQNGKPQIVNKKEAEMIGPQFDGKVLKFSIMSKGQQPGSETIVEMRMTLTSATEADLEKPDDSSAVVFKMKKSR